MTIIKRVQGNLLDMFAQGEFDAIAHGCNCFHMMGAGIAAQVAQRYPHAVQRDRDHHRLGYDATGTYSFAATPYGKQTQYGLIFNLYTQYRPGVEPRIYDNIERAFGCLNKDLKGVDDIRFGIPMIGAGLAGGDWNRIEEIINRVTPDLPITVVEYKP